MATLATRIRTRIIPAILTALGVTFLAAGVLSFTAPIGAVPLLSPSPGLEAIVEESDEPQITLPPIPTPAPATPVPSASGGPSASPAAPPTPQPTPG